MGRSSFDAACSRFGVMFLAGPAAAFANIRKALRPGAVLSFACWQSVFDNERMLIPGAAAAGVTGSLPPMPRPDQPGPDQPGPFSLADPGRVRAVLDAAGLGSVALAPHADYVAISEDQISGAALASVRAGGIRDALRDADDHTRQRALAAIKDALRARLQDGEVRASRSVLLVTGSARAGPPLARHRARVHAGSADLAADLGRPTCRPRRTRTGVLLTGVATFTAGSISCFRVMRRGCRRSRGSRGFVRVGSGLAVWREIGR